MTDIIWRRERKYDETTLLPEIVKGEIWKRLANTTGLCLVSDRGNLIINGSLQSPTLINQEWCIYLYVSGKKRWITVQELVEKAFKE